MQSKKLRNICKIFLTIVCLVILITSTKVFSLQPELNTNDFVIINNKKIYLKVADSQEKRIKGLMFIKNLPANQGMIFLFKDENLRSFWMKNVKIPLDIIFIKQNKIVHIEKNVPVEKNNHTYSSVYPCDCAIEINSGLSDLYNIRPGNFIYLSNGIKYKWRNLKEGN